MKNYFIGIDISKETLDVGVLCKKDEKMVLEIQVENSQSGINKIFSSLKKSKILLADCWFCFEHTGLYGVLLTYSLDNKHTSFSVVPALEIKLSLGIVRGKNDKVDAKRIAQYAYTHSSKLKQTILPSAELFKLKQLLSYRNQLVKISTQYKNSIKSYKLAKKVLGFNFIVSDLERHIIEIEKNIYEVDRQLNEIINSNDLLKSNFQLLKSVIGIGNIISFYMIVHTNNFQSFDEARKFNSYAGIAPFEHTSGTSVKGKTKVSNLANKRMKALLYNGANSAIMHDKEIKNYYNKKAEEGKDHQLIVNAVACKIVARAFAVVKRKTPYVSLFSQNFSKKDLVLS